MSEAEVVQFEVEDGIGVITVDNPPVNALGPGVREGIIASVDKGNADPNVRAMVLIGAGAALSRVLIFVSSANRVRYCRA